MKRSKRREETVGNNRKIVTRSVSKKQKPDDKGDDDNKNSVLLLPLDLLIEIVAKLPPKSIARFRFVSKLWLSVIRGKHFAGLFMARSLTRPCFLFTFHRGGDRLFHSSSHESPSSHHQIIRACTTLDQNYRVSAPPVRGLICFHNASKMVICNPSTGQVSALPNVKTRRKGISCFLGYDCVEDVHKVLCMTTVLNSSGPVVSSEHQVLTLGRPGRKTWRMIQCPQRPHCPATNALCKDGSVYYGAWSNTYRQGSLLVCFDFSLEVFSFVKLPEEVNIHLHPRSELVNYHTKLALVVNQSYCGGHVELWVLEDVEKQEWSKIPLVVPFWKDTVGHSYFRCMGTIRTGGFIFAPHSLHDPRPFFLVYYDDKERKATKLEFEGIGNHLPETADPVTLYLDHVESVMLL